MPSTAEQLAGGIRAGPRRVKACCAGPQQGLAYALGTHIWPKRAFQALLSLPQSLPGPPELPHDPFAPTASQHPSALHAMAPAAQTIAYPSYKPAAGECRTAAAVEALPPLAAAGIWACRKQRGNLTFTTASPPCAVHRTLAVKPCDCQEALHARKVSRGVGWGGEVRRGAGAATAAAASTLLPRTG